MSDERGWSLADGRSHGGRRALVLAGGGLAAAVFAGLVVAEAQAPLRPQTRPKLQRDVRNATMALLGGVALAALQAPITGRLTRAVESRRWGVLKVLRLSAMLEIPLAVAAMDYTLYLWHVWTHKGPLWAFHKVHHADLDMDASTALRFHFGEMIASIPYRAAQIALIGVGPRAFSVWQGFLMACVVFHHSNLRLPLWLDRAVESVLVTPRNHGVHHSVIEEETNSNWSSGLTLWDRLHGTFRRDPARAAITVGVPDLRDPEGLRLAELIAMPFRNAPR